MRYSIWVKVMTVSSHQLKNIYHPIIPNLYFSMLVKCQGQGQSSSPSPICFILSMNLHIFVSQWALLWVTHLQEAGLSSGIKLSMSAWFIYPWSQIQAVPAHDFLCPSPGSPYLIQNDSGTGALLSQNHFGFLSFPLQSSELSSCSWDCVSCKA